MLPNGRLLVSCRTSGSLNRPLAALTSGAPNPFLRKPLWLLAALAAGAPCPFLRKPHPPLGGRGGCGRVIALFSLFHRRRFPRRQGRSRGAFLRRRSVRQAPVRQAAGYSPARSAAEHMKRSGKKAARWGTRYKAERAVRLRQLEFSRQLTSTTTWSPSAESTSTRRPSAPFFTSAIS